MTELLYKIAADCYTDWPAGWLFFAFKGEEIAGFAAGNEFAMLFAAYEKIEDFKSSKWWSVSVWDLHPDVFSGMGRHDFKLIDVNDFNGTVAIGEHKFAATDAECELHEEIFAAQSFPAPRKIAENFKNGFLTIFEPDGVFAAPIVSDLDDEVYYNPLKKQKIGPAIKKLNGIRINGRFVANFVNDMTIRRISITDRALTFHGKIDEFAACATVGRME